MIIVPGKSILVLEIRNDERRKVLFSALEFAQNRFLWKDLQMDEPWWINLFVAREGKVILSKFDTTNNPDSVSYVSIDLETAAF